MYHLSQFRQVVAVVYCCCCVLLLLLLTLFVVVFVVDSKLYLSQFGNMVTVVLAVVSS